MCGIVGYVGPRVATPLLIDGLKRMEYRGYDSAGVALLGDDGVDMRRAKGKIATLESVVATRPIGGTTGHRAHAVGHARGAEREATRIRSATAPTRLPWCTTGSSRTTASCGGD